MTDTAHYSPKALRQRIDSTQATRRITSAMKMVAVTKLKKAQDAAEASRPYAERMARLMGGLAAGSGAGGPKLLAGTGSDQTHLIVLISSDRGLCGGFNGQLARAVRQQIIALQGAGKSVKLMIIGRKGVALLKREFEHIIIERFEELAKPAPSFAQAQQVMDKILSLFDAGEFDVCTIYYNKFISAMSQVVTPLQVIPFVPTEEDNDGDEKPDALDNHAGQEKPDAVAPYEYEPDEETILAALLPQNLRVQMLRAMLESFASEQGARMVAMDNATRNASDMISTLTTRYNRVRQAQITKELVEIISGAEAL